MALRTGRLHLESIEQPVLQTGATLKGNLIWRRDAQGRQQLQIDHGSEAEQANLTLLPTWPPWYVDAARNQAGPIQFDLPEDIAYQLLAAPPLDEIDAC